MAMGAIAYQKTKKQQQKAREEKYHVPYGPYEAFLKRPLDIVISIIALKYVWQSFFYSGKTGKRWGYI